MRIGPEFRHGQDWGFSNHRSPIKFTSVEKKKLEIPSTSGPIFFYACDAMR